MNKSIKLFLLVAAIFASCFSSVSAQKFQWKAEVEKVAANGFYNIPLSPEINGRMKPDFSDVRIYDEAGKEVPYLLRKDQSEVQISTFAEYEILEKTHKENCCTELLLHNPQHKPINNIKLIIKNADVIKQAKLSGSDDNKNWYVVKDKHEFRSINNTATTAMIKILDFPLVNYKYFRLWISDSLSAPVNILQAGYYVHFTEKGNYSEIPKPLISQADSVKEKRTYVTISYPSPQYIDKLELQIKGPVFYHRKAYAEVKDTLQNGNIYFRPVADFTFRSGTANTFSFSHEKIKDLRIIIENEDNPALQIVAAQAWQLRHYVTAFLESGKGYKLQFGSKKTDIKAPSYDLHYFKDSIASDIPFAELKNIAEIQQTTPIITAQSSSFFNKTFFIWIAIAFVVLLLGFVTMRMVREMES